MKVRIAARLPKHVADWYNGLGSGNLTDGLLRAYEMAQEQRGRKGGPSDKEARHARLAGELYPAWVIYRRTPGLLEEERIAWIESRLRRAIGEAPSPADIEGVLAQLLAFGRTT